ncbi:hypothetical protein NKH82_32735 [Mesorhizobium sp. M0915]|uniref:hypothetical protein n=1 Tax=Mesorhizobium sp. M0915 TaxID=2957027 RepID=UPI00333DD839
MPHTSCGIALGATVAAGARQYDVATSLIWRGTVRARETGFAEVVVVPDGPVAASVPAPPPTMIELEIAGKVRLRILLTTPPTGGGDGEGPGRFMIPVPSQGGSD